MDCEIFIRFCTIKDILKKIYILHFGKSNFPTQKITFSIIKLTWFYHLITFLHSTAWKYNWNLRFPFRRNAKIKSTKWKPYYWILMYITLSLFYCIIMFIRFIIILILPGLEINASYYILYFTSRLYVMYVRHLFYSCFCFKSGQVSQ